MANSPPEFNFFKPWKAFFGVSVLLTMAAVAIMTVRTATSEARSPLNLGVDFTGGNTYVLQSAERVTSGEVRRKFTFLKKEPIVQVSEGDQPTIIVRTSPLEGAEREKVQEVIQQSGWEVQEQVEVGPAFSRDLVVNAVFAVLVSSLLILIYIAIRFRFAYAIGAIVALVHDALIVLGVFSLFQFEVNVPFIAAVLTIIGYSVNDTIINFDRIRENLKLYPRMDLIPLVNKSIVQVLSRTINTAGTTLVTVFAVLILGGPTLKTFMLALAIGFFSGIYSSWFVATPVVVLFDMLSQKSAQAQKAGGGVTVRKSSRPPGGEPEMSAAPSAPGVQAVSAGGSGGTDSGARKRADRKKKPRRR
jgi:preprotein translocase subunit SecF